MIDPADGGPIEGATLSRLAHNRQLRYFLRGIEAVAGLVIGALALGLAVDPAVTVAEQILRFAILPFFFFVVFLGGYLSRRDVALHKRLQDGRMP